MTATFSASAIAIHDTSLYFFSHKTPRAVGDVSVDLVTALTTAEPIAVPVAGGSVEPRAGTLLVDNEYIAFTQMPEFGHSLFVLNRQQSPNTGWAEYDAPGQGGNTPLIALVAGQLVRASGKAVGAELVAVVETIPERSLGVGGSTTTPAWTPLAQWPAHDPPMAMVVDEANVYLAQVSLGKDVVPLAYGPRRL